MQRDRSNQSGSHQRAPDATRYEIVQCTGCGHDWVRPAAKRTNQLPCGKCFSRDLTSRPLLAGGVPQRLAVFA